MLINNEILRAFIHCRYKAFRKNKQERGITSDYQTLYNQIKQIQELNFEKTFFSNINSNFSDTTYDNTIYSKEGIALKLNFKNENVDLRVDGIEFKSRKNIVPIFITPFEKVTKSDKLFIALQASLIQTEFNLQAESCKVIFGKNIRQTKFKLSPFAKAIKNTITELHKSLSTTNSPPFFKNEHCQVCEYRINCLEKLLEKDDLSLLAGLKPKEIQQKNDRGIFSVKQLSYLFRPKKNPYRKRKFLPELKALAIREKKTFVKDIPDISTSKNEIYLDIEGLPDRNFYYLIGVAIKTNNTEQCYSFWANNETEEQNIFAELITLLQTLSEFKVYHYGSYEIQAFKAVSKKLASEHQQFIKKILEHSFNLLNVFTDNIYPPTYSNGLKEIAKFIKYEWSEPNASGLQSIVWRYKWELTNNTDFKNKLVQYNLEDCLALISVRNWLSNIPKEESESFESASNIKIETTKKWGTVNFIIKEFEQINRYAYFEYQRNKVYIKTYPEIKKKRNQRSQDTRFSHLSLKPNKIVQIQLPNNCPNCSNNKFYRHDKRTRVVIDLKISKSGLRRFVTLYHTGRFRCRSCNRVFTPDKFKELCIKYGDALRCWIINQSVNYRISYKNIAAILKETFNIDFNRAYVDALKTEFADYYKSLYSDLFNCLIRGSLVHIDETTFNLRNGNGYVWVFANMNTVCYLFRSTREADFLRQVLEDFRGVLISDFFAGYDAINCPKQRCLVHLIRDINDDLVKNQQNMEFKNLVNNFSNLLNEIISTVNRFGLKRRNLNKHKKNVSRFFKKLQSREFETELCEKWGKRFLSYHDELFTFMNFDGVPWNNNNAENAIKAVALYRRDVNGYVTEKTIQDHLTLLSIFQTCKLRNINFFDFLLSSEKNTFEYSIKHK